MQRVELPMDFPETSNRAGELVESLYDKLRRVAAAKLIEARAVFPDESGKRPTESMRTTKKNSLRAAGRSTQAHASP